MYRTHTCGELRISDVEKTVTLSGWVDASRAFGPMTFVDLRDRYGITQVVFENNEALNKQAMTLGREFVVKIEGTVRERSAKNANRPTGDVEIVATALEILNVSKTPPFTIKDETDGGDDIRMKYRYLDLRRGAVQKNLIFRSNVAIETRKYLSNEQFIEVETPNLIKSTPEGARDFVVPSRMNAGQFYALPQSPQTFKQLLMVSGFDKYFQIVKCFRDEDLRADRQPEFTQIDCEMSFVTQEDILNTFEGLTKHLFKTCLNVDLPDFPRMTYDEAASKYGSDKPDVRFGMPFVELNDLAKGKGFPVFDGAELVVAINTEGVAAKYSNKTINELTDWVKRPQVGAKGLAYVKFEEDGSIKSPLSKFYSEDDFKAWADKCGAKKGDIIFILSGEAEKTRKQLSELRLELGNRLFLRTPKYGLKITNLKSKIQSLSKYKENIYGLRIKPESKISENNIKDLIKSFSDEIKKANLTLDISVHKNLSLYENKLLTKDNIASILNNRKLKDDEFYLVFAGEGNIFALVNQFRMNLGKAYNLYHGEDFKPLWVVDFPLLEWDEDTQRFYAMHHPFTSPKREQIPSMLSGDHETMKNLRADAYDLVLNGVEIGGGSIRIYDRDLQSKNFKLLGMTEEEAESKFGFLLGAFEYGAPPHGGIAFGFDRLCAVMSGSNSIRDFIAFPKNNQGRDIMIDAPSFIEDTQLAELSIDVVGEKV